MPEPATIRIENLRLRAIIGINDWERQVRQDVIVNVWMAADIEKAAKTDDIADTVDYKGLKNLIIEHVEGSDYGLIESLASSILRIVNSQDKVLAARVRVEKPKALSGADSVSVKHVTR